MHLQACIHLTPYVEYGYFCVRLPLDDKLLERDMQVALKLSKESTGDDVTEKTGLLQCLIIPFGILYK